ncbi:hypothetical protein PPYR_10243 [Photinus pyralis]|uniref:Uncharacterized protein n=1 Tax=Photinus pyralis TaxID=7054 RepID=A0A5N4AFR2_PHOPY|nr:hypothetical protein PPYR_10243 [Photinus pyralis]
MNYIVCALLLTSSLLGTFVGPAVLTDTAMENADGKPDQTEEADTLPESRFNAAGDGGCDRYSLPKLDQSDLKEPCNISREIDDSLHSDLTS